MFPKSLLIVMAITSGVYCGSKITVSVTNETHVDLQTYLADLEVAAATAQYSANLNARLVNMLQELLAQKRVNCNFTDDNNWEKDVRLPGYTYVGNSSVGFILYTDEPLTWNEARKSCRREKSALAVPRSQAEINVMKALLSEVHELVGFVGLHHLYGKDDWLTVSGETIPDFLYRHNEAVGKPMYPDRIVPSGKCTGFTVNAELTSMDCNSRYMYFCEIRQ